MQYKSATRLLVAAAAVVTLVGCAGSTEGPSVDGDAQPMLSAKAAVRLLARHGIPVPNPLVTTRQECPRAGCQLAVVTDTMRVKSFATEQLAEQYAQLHGASCDGNIVVTFAPPLSRSERSNYWRAIEKAL